MGMVKGLLSKTIVFGMFILYAEQLLSGDYATTGVLFADKPNAALYWRALTQVANNQKEAALSTVGLIRAGKSASEQPSHCAEPTSPFDGLLDEFFIAKMSRYPQSLTKLGLFEAIGITEHNAYLNNISRRSLFDALAINNDMLATLEQYPLDELSADQKNAHAVFCWQTRQAVMGEQFLMHEYFISQMWSPITDLTALFTQAHPLNNSQDVAYYLARLKCIPQVLQQAIERFEWQTDNNIKLPQFALQKVIAMLQQFLPQPVTEHIFYKRLASRLEILAIDGKEDLLAQAAAVLQHVVYPGYEAMLAALVRLQDQLTTNDGVWALPDGDEYYAYTLANHTTTDLTPEEICELGLREVTKIHQQMRGLLARLNFRSKDKSAIALFREFAQAPEFYYANDEQGRQQCLDQYGVIMERCRKELYPLFDRKPRASVQMVATPKHEEEGRALAYYMRPSMDGSRPGMFFVNLRDMAEAPTYGMETLAVHEAEPGHHFQLSIEQEMAMHILRKITGSYTAYVEGWALYVEKLAYEEGFYSSPAAQLGHLQDELLRAARLVVDTGIHHRRWTREQAIDYMLQNTGCHPNEIVTEVERYFVMPGQACAYKIGQLKILELRQRLKDALGDQFDIRQFHNLVLELGACPLAMLEEAVDKYIQQVSPRRCGPMRSSYHLASGKGLMAYMSSCR